MKRAMNLIKVKENPKPRKSRSLEEDYEQIANQPGVDANDQNRKE